MISWTKENICKKYGACECPTFCSASKEINKVLMQKLVLIKFLLKDMYEKQKLIMETIDILREEVEKELKDNQ
jgi:hypothetical protein